MFRLDGKIALVTGATSGIGAEIAKTFSDAGAKLVLTGRDISRLQESCKIPDCHYVAADLSKSGEAQRVIDEVFEQFGHIDILVNNAGVTHDALLVRMTDRQWDDVMNVNLRAAFELCRAAAISMMLNRFGRIINITSIIGAIGGPGQANYAASKGALTAMSKSIAAELGGRNVTANCIAPGFIKTPMTDALKEELKAEYLKQIPAGRFGTPADIAAAALFLASDAASYINGHTLHINGGMARL